MMEYTEKEYKAALKKIFRGADRLMKGRNVMYPNGYGLCIEKSEDMLHHASVVEYRDRSLTMVDQTAPYLVPEIDDYGYAYDLDPDQLAELADEIRTLPPKDCEEWTQEACGYATEFGGAHSWVDDIEEWTTAEWEASRTGIGGSDCGKLFGASSFSTIPQLYWEKMDEKDVAPQESDWIRFQVGHYLEPLIIEIFAKRNPGWEPFVDRRMFRHPEKFWMMADCDGFVRCPDGRIFILEIKTTAEQNLRTNWGKPEDNLVPLSYEYQVRHYMAVTGCEGAIICCLGGNTESGYRQRLILRDENMEKDILDTEEEFWVGHIMTATPPTFDGSDARKALEAIKAHFGTKEGHKTLSDEASQEMAEWIRLEEQRKAMEGEVRSIKKKQDSLMVRSLSEMKGMAGRFGIVTGKGDSEAWEIIFQARSNGMKLKKELVDNFRTEYPELFEKYVEPGGSTYYPKVRKAKKK